MPLAVLATVSLTLSLLVVLLALLLPNWPRRRRIGLLLLASALGLESALLRYLPDPTTLTHRLLLCAALGYFVAGVLALWQTRRWH